MRNQLIRTKEIVIGDVIEGEFAVEEASGFSCRNCHQSLLVGATECPDCGTAFSLPTPHIRNVPDGYSPARAKVMAEVFKQRVTTAEADRVRAIVYPEITNPKFIKPKWWRES